MVNTVSSMRNSHVRSVRVAVPVFLTKLRLGLSNRVLAVLFNLENKRVVFHINNQVRKALMKSFIPYHLGLKHITRETAIEQHQTAITAILHTNKSNQLCVIADTTYLFIQKSSNNQLQRKFYSMHKHRNLVKPMILTTTESIICYFFVLDEIFSCVVNIYITQFNCFTGWLYFMFTWNFFRL